MKLTESYTSRFTLKQWDLGQYNYELKQDYKNKCSSEIKTYKLSEKEMEKYLKKFK